MRDCISVMSLHTAHYRSTHSHTLVCTQEHTQTHMHTGAVFVLLLFINNTVGNELIHA